MHYPITKKKNMYLLWVGLEWRSGPAVDYYSQLSVRFIA